MDPKREREIDLERDGSQETDLICLNQTMKGVDVCSLGHMQKRGNGNSKQDRKRRKTSSMGSAGGFINCARLMGSAGGFINCFDQQQRLHNPILPRFIPCKAAHEGHDVYCFSPFRQGKSYTLGSRKEIPWSQRIIVFPFGTCHPYIVALFPSCDLLGITLLNPISGHDITLPASPISWSDYERAPCFALSLWHSSLSLSLSQSSPSSPPSYTVFIVFRTLSPKLMFYRKGDHDWTRLNLPWILSSFITFRGDLYGLRESKEERYLLAVHITHPTPTIEEFCMDMSQLPLEKTRHCFNHHLVESPNGEELLLVLENTELYEFTTIGFQVFMADLSKKTWIRKETLGDRVLIIKDQQSILLSAASLGHGVKGNCIYFFSISATGQPLLKMFDLDSEKMTDVSIPFPSQSYPSQSNQVMFVSNIC